MINDKLAQHISNELWVQKSKVVEVLGKFKETPTPVKHPIELVNEKYPNGWYCEAFEEVQLDMVSATNNENFLNKYALYVGKGHSNMYSWCEYKAFEYRNLPLITKSEYLDITRGVTDTPQPTKQDLVIDEQKPLTADDLVVGGKYVPISKSVGIEVDECPHFKKSKEQGYFYYLGYDEKKDQYTFCINQDGNKYLNGSSYLPSDVIAYVEPIEQETPQRDYKGVRYIENGHYYSISKKDGNYYASSELGLVTKEAIDYYFANGIWVELPQKEHNSNDSTTIHASKPSDVTLEERVKALELSVNEIKKDKECDHVEAPTLKRNLSIDTPVIDWKKVECLSWEDVKRVSELCGGGMYMSNLTSDSKKLEHYIKNKLKK